MSRADAVLGFSELVEDMEKSRTTIEKGLWLSDDNAGQGRAALPRDLEQAAGSGGIGKLDRSTQKRFLAAPDNRTALRIGGVPAEIWQPKRTAFVTLLV